MNKTWQLRALAAYLAVGAPLAASCAREANTLEEEPEGSGGSSSGATSKAGNTAKTGTSNAFGGTASKGGSGGKTTMTEGGEAPAEGGEGTGGSAGSSAGGTAGGGGMGGMIGVPPDVLANASVVLHYLCQETAVNSSKIFMKLFIENKSDDPLPMANVKVRYWFTSEAASPQVTAPYDGGNIEGLTNTFVLDADNSHVLITFSGNDILKGADLNANEFQLQIEGGAQNQSNDWSFQAAYTARMPHDKITVYLDDELIWGCEPSNTCAGDGGGGGGVTGAGGAD
jgi:hypothetical protein